MGFEMPNERSFKSVKVGKLLPNTKRFMEQKRTRRKRKIKSTE